jgi:hypothetical protein
MLTRVLVRGELLLTQHDPGIGTLLDFDRVFNPGTVSNLQLPASPVSRYSDCLRGSLLDCRFTKDGL